MRFKVDEDLAGASDPALMATVASESRALLALDKGIANLQQFPAGGNAGVVLFRPARSGRRSVLEFIRAKLPEWIQLDLPGRLTMVGPTRIRTRK